MELLCSYCVVNHGSGSQCRVRLLHSTSALWSLFSVYSVQKNTFLTIGLFFFFKEWTSNNDSIAPPLITVTTLWLWCSWKKEAVVLSEQYIDLSIESKAVRTDTNSHQYLQLLEPLLSQVTVFCKTIVTTTLMRWTYLLLPWVHLRACTFLLLLEQYESIQCCYLNRKLTSVSSANLFAASGKFHLWTWMLTPANASCHSNTN